MEHYLINGLVGLGIALWCLYAWKKYNNKYFLWVVILEIVNAPLYLLQYLLNSGTLQTSPELKLNLLNIIFYSRWAFIALFVIILIKAFMENKSKKI